jgi:aspartyl protease family protein
MRSTSSIVILWLLVAATIYWAFSSFIARQHNPNQSTLVASSGQSLLLKRSRDGHFRLSATINGEPVTMLIDTGASSITLGEPLAQRLGLPRGERYTTQTANGTAPAYETQLDELVFGPFKLTQLRAGVVPQLGDEVLLGMNVLKKFDIQLRGDEMQLRLANPATN